MYLRFLPATLLLSGLLLTGCSTFNDNELGIIRGSGVTPRLYDKMERGRELRPEDIIELTRRHVPDRYILRQIDDTGVDYALTPDDYKRLEKARVSPAVLDALVAASDEFSNRYVSPRRAVFYSNPDPYLYDDYDYYGPGFVGRPYPIHGDIGIGISSGHRRWR